MDLEGVSERYVEELKYAIGAYRELLKKAFKAGYMAGVDHAIHVIKFDGYDGIMDQLKEKKQ